MRQPMHTLLRVTLGIVVGVLGYVAISSAALLARRYELASGPQGPVFFFLTVGLVIALAITQFRVHINTAMAAATTMIAICGVFLAVPVSLAYMDMEISAVGILQYGARSMIMPCVASMLLVSSLLTHRAAHTRPSS